MLFRSMRSFLCIALLFFLTLVFIPILLILLPFRMVRIKLGNLYGRILSSCLLYLMRTKLEISHRERLYSSCPNLYISNHTSLVDTLIMMNVVPGGTASIAKKEVAYFPLFGWIYFLSGHLLIDRKNRSTAVHMLKKTAEEIKKYKIGICMWPEGTRSQDGRLKEFKKGFAHLAIDSGLSIIPMVVHKAYEKWPKHGGVDFSPMTIQVDILDRVDTSSWNSENLDQRIRGVWDLFVRSLDESQRPSFS